MVSRNAALWPLSVCFHGENIGGRDLVPLISLSMHLRFTSIIHLLAQCDSVPAYLSKRPTVIIPVVSADRLAKNETLFSVHVPRTVYQKRITVDRRFDVSPLTYVRVHRNNSGAAESACEYAHHHHHHYLGYQKTRWHLKERSRGQEASLALPRRPYREMQFPSSPSSLPAAPTTYRLPPCSIRSPFPPLFPLLWQSRDHPSAAASAASLRLPSSLRPADPAAGPTDNPRE